MFWTFEELNLIPLDLLIRRNDRRTCKNWGLFMFSLLGIKWGESWGIRHDLRPNLFLGLKVPDT